MATLLPPAVAAREAGGTRQPHGAGMVQCRGCSTALLGRPRRAQRLRALPSPFPQPGMAMLRAAGCPRGGNPEFQPGQSGELAVPLGHSSAPSTLTQEAGEGRADLAPAPGVLRGGEQQGLGRARPVEVGPAAGEGDAVVGGVDHQRAVEETSAPQLLQDQPDPCRRQSRAGWLQEGPPCARVPAQFRQLLPWSMRPMVVYWAARSARAAGVSGTKGGTYVEKGQVAHGDPGGGCRRQARQPLSITLMLTAVVEVCAAPGDPPTAPCSPTGPHLHFLRAVELRLPVGDPAHATLSIAEFLTEGPVLGLGVPAAVGVVEGNIKEERPGDREEVEGV